MLTYYLLSACLISIIIHSYSYRSIVTSLLKRPLNLRSIINTNSFKTHKYQSFLQFSSDRSNVEDDVEYVTNDEKEIEENSEEIETTTVAEADNSTITIDPIEVAIKDRENELKVKIERLESTLRSEKAKLLKLKDRVSESGKMGFYMVQAQVHDFQKKRDTDQSNLVEKSKRDFVVKILPIIDNFREAESLAPATNEREQSMHKNFGSLLSNILSVIEKYGYKEFDAVVGNKLDSHRHKVVKVIKGEEDGLIVEELKKGVIHSSNGEIIRPAFVVATTISEPSAPKSADSSESKEEAILVDTDEIIVGEEETTNSA